MSVSKVKICNLALFKVNGSRITSFEDNSKEAELCNEFYDMAVENVLRSYIWNCAKNRRALSRLSETPAFGWEYQYQLPSDCLRVIAMEPDNIDYVIESGKLLTNSATCAILYIRKISDPNQFDALLVEVIALDLAAKIAFPLSGNPGLTGKMEQSKEQRLIEAISINAIENNHKNKFQNSAKINSTWDKARY